MLLKITAKKCKPFPTDEGDMLDYFWYVSVREGDGITIKFGSMRGDHEVGDVEEIDLEKTEKFVVKNGKKSTIIVYKESFFPAVR